MQQGGKLMNAKDQFVHDYTLVIDNDFTAWREVMDIVRGSNRDLVTVSETLREQFEQYVGEVADREEQEGNQVGALLIQQMLLNWGSEAFDSIARHYIGKDEE
jgi:hypothetical protein